VLEVHGATVDYGGLRAVDEVSLEIRPGTIVGLIGPNGAGKTSLFNAISGFAPLTSGTVCLDGRDLTSLPPHRRAAAGLSRTFQNIGLAKELTLRENLRLAQHAQATYDDVSALLRSKHVRQVEASLDEQATAAMTALGLERYADTPVRRLSIGQQRLVEIAAVLLSRPRLLMLDEPAAGLSPAASESLAERLIGLRDEHDQTLLLIEHNVPLVFATCDYVYVMDAGGLLAQGTPDELVRNDRVLDAYLGTAYVDPAAEPVGANA
jgi:branched-chain amino acid transport system ATP-binding protein